MFPIEAFQSTLGKFADILKRHRVAFHLTGGVTSVAYAEPRMTQDIDVVVDNFSFSSNLKSILQDFAEGQFLFNELAIQVAVKSRRMFQLLDSVESLKLDVYPRELVKGELQRSGEIELFSGVFYPVASKIDTAISKLLWIQQGSHKSRRDLRILFNNADLEEQNEITSKSEAYRVSELLSEVLSESDEIDL